jgi:hypothetical protein
MILIGLLALGGCAKIKEKTVGVYDYAYKIQPLKEYMAPGTTQSFSIRDACVPTYQGKFDIDVCTRQTIKLKVESSHPTVVKLLDNVDEVVNKQGPSTPLTLHFKALEIGTSAITITADNGHNTRVIRYNIHVQQPTATRTRFVQCTQNVFVKDQNYYISNDLNAGDHLLVGSGVEHLKGSNATIAPDGTIRFGPHSGPTTVTDTFTHKVVLSGEVIAGSDITDIAIAPLQKVTSIAKTNSSDASVIHYIDIAEKAGNHFVCRPGQPPLKITIANPKDCQQTAGNYKQYVKSSERVPVKGYRYEFKRHPHAACQLRVETTTDRHLVKEIYLR